MATAVLKTTKLSKRFGSKIAVNSVSMTINKGEIYGFIGKNGSGKTTFMRTVLGGAFASSGQIELFGGEEHSVARRKIGSLIETPAFYKNCTARENLIRLSYLCESAKDEITDLLRFVGLGGVANKKVGHFSLGMKQRLGIAAAMLGNPEFLILDEPVNGLDPSGIKEIRDIILTLNRERGITFLISSHLLDELSKIATKYGIINDGVLVEEITAEELLKRCNHKLIFTLDNKEKAAEILCPVVGEENMFPSDNGIVLKTDKAMAGKLNRLLVTNDITVSGIEYKSDSLEQYFIERIGV